MQKGYVLLDVVVALGIIAAIIGVLVAGNGAVFSIQQSNTSYYKSMKHFSNHLESLYEKDWEGLTEEGNQYFKCYYEKSLTEHNTVQLKVIGEVQGQIIEVCLEKPSTGDKGVKPIAIITMSPDSNITDQTEIVWSYSASYDPSGFEIVDAEWQNKQTIYPEGKHVAWLRVQNAINIWSDWVRITFTVVSAQPPEASEERVPVRTIADLKGINKKLDADYVLMGDIDLLDHDWVPIGHKKTNHLLELSMVMGL